MIHELKILPHFFREVISGRKTFEIRKNDRPFRKGDMLALNEYDAEKKDYTGNSCLVWIDYLLEGDYCKEGYVTMAIKPCVVWKKDRPRSEMTVDFDYSVPYATKESEVDVV